MPFVFSTERRIPLGCKDDIEHLYIIYFLSLNTHWGGITEDNNFGTHELLDLCEQLGCEPYITGTE
ncbi:MAG: hypothetical protein LBK18_02285 [Prevotellaceae bacterium]|jgi:hypothetical protein|nr:hypothetical protein [Prevotellaceae bacterium]